MVRCALLPIDRRRAKGRSGRLFGRVRVWVWFPTLLLIAAVLSTDRFESEARACQETSRATARLALSTGSAAEGSSTRVAFGFRDDAGDLPALDRVARTLASAEGEHAVDGTGDSADAAGDGDARVASTSSSAVQVLLAARAELALGHDAGAWRDLQPILQIAESGALSIVAFESPHLHAALALTAVEVLLVRGEAAAARGLLDEVSVRLGIALDSAAAAAPAAGAGAEAAGAPHELDASGGGNGATDPRQLDGLDQLLAAVLHRQAGEAAWLSGDHAHARRYLERSLQMHIALAGPAHVDVAVVRSTLGTACGEQSAFEVAEELHAEAISVLLAAPAARPVDRVSALLRRGQTAFIRGDLAASQHWCRLAWRTARETLHPDARILGGIANGLGALAHQSGDFAEALHWYREAVDRLGNDGAQQTAEAANRLNNLAAVLFRTQRYEEAERLAREALAIWQGLDGNESAQVATAWNNLAVILRELRRFEEARSCVQQAKDLTERLHGPNSRQMGLVRCGEARLLAAMGEFDAASRSFQDGIHLLEAHVEARNPLLIQAWAEWGLMLAEFGDKALAKPTLERALEAADGLHIDDPASPVSWALLSEVLLLAEVSVELARLHIEAGEAETAFEVLERSRGRTLDRLVSSSSGVGIVPMTARSVRSSLGETEALVIYGWSRRSVVAIAVAGSTASDSSPVCVAEIIARSAEEVSELESEIDAFVRVLRQDPVLARGGVARRAARATPVDEPSRSFDSLWMPQAKHLGDRLLPLTLWSQMWQRKLLVVCADGPVARVPFDVLAPEEPGSREGRPGECIIDRGPLIVGAPSAGMFQSCRERRQQLRREASPGRLPTAVIVADPHGADAVLYAHDGGPGEAAHRPAFSMRNAPENRADDPSTEGVTATASSGDDGSPQMTALMERLWPVSPAPPLPDGPLAGSVREAEGIARALGSRGWAVEVLEGDAATIDELEKRIEWADLLHFATHGLPPRSRDPYSAGLVMSSTGRLSHDDDNGDDHDDADRGAWADAHAPGHVLTLGRVLQEWRGRLSGCSLVVLSACESGAMETIGDSVFSMPVAFMVAGAPTVVASAWPVDDAAGAALMMDFYQHLIETSFANIPASLRVAQQRQRARYPHPFYWATYGVMGGMD